VRGSDVKQVEAASEMLRHMESGEFPSLRKHLIEVDRDAHQPLALEVVAQLSEE
jgi:hypothetical protein